MHPSWVSSPNGNDALPLEYKLKYRSACRYAHVTDFVNNTLCLGISGQHEGRPEEHTFNFLGVNCSPFGDDGRDLSLVVPQTF